MLHEDSQEAKCFFSPNKEAIYFSNIEDLVNQCEFYLNNESARKVLIKNCSKKIKDGNYSYQKMVENYLGSIFRVYEDADM